MYLAVLSAGAIAHAEYKYGMRRRGAMTDDRENRLYQARLYCEQARIIVAPLRITLLTFLLDMILLELRASAPTPAEETESR